LGQGLLIHEASRSHTSTPPHSVGLWWTSDHLVAETSTWHHKTQQTFISRWDSNPQSQQEKGCKPTPWTAWPLRPAEYTLRRLICRCAYSV